jgi:uncharacterized protein (TIGR02147 family)
MIYKLNSMEMSVFDFEHYQDYLSVIRRQYPSRKNKPIAYSIWARRLQYRSPRSIAMVVKGQRLPSIDMIRRISADLNHTDTERQYLELLVELERKKRRQVDFKSTLQHMQRIVPRSTKAFVDAKTFEYVADWYCLVIKQFMNTPGFKEDLCWISARLRKKVSPAVVSKAINTMLSLGIVERSTRTKRLSVVNNELTTSNDIPSAAIKEHHRQMLHRALEAITEQDVQNRELSSLTLMFDKRKLKAAKQAIRRFKTWFDSEFVAQRADSVYQLNIQFFEHTDEPGANGGLNEKNR